MSSDFLGEDFYIGAITALLPLTAGLLVLQKNPYQALVIRGILGAIAALVYALFGAADVALTEALVGTMLSITLYAVAVRSSMTVRVGMVETDLVSPQLGGSESERKEPVSAITTRGNLAKAASTETSLLRRSLETTESEAVTSKNLTESLTSADLVAALDEALCKYYVRIELSTYPDIKALNAALADKSVHLAYGGTASPTAPIAVKSRVRRLYDILSGALPANIPLDYVDLANPLSPPPVSMPAIKRS